MKDAITIFRFLLDADARGERSALVTVTDVIGGSSRAPGTHMAVTENGRSVGTLSGGCVEAAVIGEAQRVIAERRAESMRFGAGSPLIDIRLPCGGGIDLLFVPDPDVAAIRAAHDWLASRQPVALRIARDGRLAVADPAANARSTWDGGTFVAYHAPDLKLFILGHGAEIQALAALGRAYGMDVVALSSDPSIVERLSGEGFASHLLATPARSPHLAADAHAAVVFLFHDHDWEIDLLAQALGQDAFYIGAMGSRTTHAIRSDALLRHGMSPADVARVVGPIGLIPATRDPDTLALSVLAQIVERRPAA